MLLKKVKILNFKNLPGIDLSFDKGIYYLYSPNGTGKTNFLEALQILTVGKSLRSKSENDFFNFNSKKKKVIVKGEFEDEERISFKQTYILERDVSKRKSLFRNKSKISINDYIGRIPSIWFSPENIKIISSSPLNKRKYFDAILVQLLPDYNFNLRAYNRSLKQRNRVLQSEYIDKVQIKVWTENLIKYGSKIIKSRQKFYDSVNLSFKELKNFPRYEFQIDPLPNIQIDTIFDEDTEYKFRTELQRTYQRDLINRSTTAGPHKDDWELKIRILPNEKFISLERFASRGQQRMSLIILQIVLINIFVKSKDILPILLLDDIFSELDKVNERILLDFIKEKKIQTFITGVGKIRSKGIKQINLSTMIN